MKKVLIIDDEDYVLSMLCTICKSLGFEEITTVLCRSAEDAETAIVENEPDILFLDYQFSTRAGAKTGADIAKWIDDYYELPIAVATHTYRDENKARTLFEETKCVTHFVRYDRELIRNFLEYAMSL
jgi:DNA-binding LytR/AlgR family response regulator